MCPHGSWKCVLMEAGSKDYWALNNCNIVIDCDRDLLWNVWSTKHATLPNYILFMCPFRSVSYNIFFSLYFQQGYYEGHCSISVKASPQSPILTVHSIQYNTVHCIPYNTIYSVHITVYSTIQYTIYTIPYSVQYNIVYSIMYAVCSVLYKVYRI